MLDPRGRLPYNVFALGGYGHLETHHADFARSKGARESRADPEAASREVFRSAEAILTQVKDSSKER